MKKIFGILIGILVLSTVGRAQEETISEKLVPKKTAKPSRDFVMFQLTYNNWNGTPDSVNVTGIGRGFNGYICYDFPIKASNFSFAAGLGISTNSIYFKDQKVIMNTSATAIAFQDIDASMTNLYKRNKLTTTYLEAPFELRYFGNKENRNKGFKVALGMRVGLLMGTSAKTRHTIAGPAIVEKVNTTRYVQNWRFAPTARIGWGNFSLYGSYNISQLFNAGQGPEVFPYALGICITGL